jgi:hypothetical protein
MNNNDTYNSEGGGVTQGSTHDSIMVNGQNDGQMENFRGGKTVNNYAAPQSEQQKMMIDKERLAASRKVLIISTLLK